MKRLMRSVVIYNETQYGCDWPSHNLVEAVAWLQRQLDLIHPNFRDSAMLDIDTRFDGYSDSEKRACIKISYLRPETIDEYNERVALADKQKNLQRERDLKVLAELKAKYGDT